MTAASSGLATVPLRHQLDGTETEWSGERHQGNYESRTSSAVDRATRRPGERGRAALRGHGLPGAAGPGSDRVAEAGRARAGAEPAADGTPRSASRRHPAGLLRSHIFPFAPRGGAPIRRPSTRPNARQASTTAKRDRHRA
jgi:hypothetical protein